MKPLSERMTLYMDAGFPIIYIETFEEDKAERAVVTASSNREILEWNVRGLFYSKVDEKREGISLLEALNNFANPDAMGNEKFARRFSLKRRVLLIKDAQELLDVPEESEANMRHAIALAEAISPCVLWIDELEKAFAGIGGGGNEVTTRLFGTFLTWMQEKDGLAFVVATANNITHMPPELLRKGRFDEIFYVGLPSPAERAKIFEIHLGRRRPKDLANIDIAKLAKATEGYSGADIEGVVKDAIELSFTNDLPAVSTDTILQAI